MSFLTLSHCRGVWSDGQRVYIHQSCLLDLHSFLGWFKLHEFGHGYHNYLSLAHQKLLAAMEAPEEFSECAAMSMMMLCYAHLTAGDYSQVEAQTIIQNNLVRCLTDIPRFALEDAFEHWVYSEAPEHIQAQDLDAKWLELSLKFLPEEDWNGMRAAQMTGWQRNTWSLFPLSCDIWPHHTHRVGIGVVLAE